jgi:hypothetical protein
MCHVQLPAPVNGDSHVPGDAIRRGRVSTQLVFSRLQGTDKELGTGDKRHEELHSPRSGRVPMVRDSTRQVELQLLVSGLVQWGPDDLYLVQWVIVLGSFQGEVVIT